MHGSYKQPLLRTGTTINFFQLGPFRLPLLDSLYQTEYTRPDWLYQADYRTRLTTSLTIPYRLYQTRVTIPDQTVYTILTTPDWLYQTKLTDYTRRLIIFKCKRLMLLSPIGYVNALLFFTKICWAKSAYLCSSVSMNQINMEKQDQDI